jgi:hypothetical protein
MCMALPSPVLPRQRPDPYRPDVPRAPKNFKIDSVSIEPLQPKGYVPTGPDSAVPSRFEAHFALGLPEASVTIEVFVHSNLGPVVIDIAIRTRADAPVTTSLLRQVLVDQLLQRAVQAATVPAAVRSEWLASLPVSVRDAAQSIDTTREPTLTADERTRIQFDDDARLAAQHYQEAVAAGSRGPTMAVAHAMNRSRAQAARYIRRARQLRLLPQPESTTKS